ncbi:MAG: hypothetical protein GXN94_02325 [Aquificae bacterium]|nr:hypothetical protein [Aquificota bacterium]
MEEREIVRLVKSRKKMVKVVAPFTVLLVLGLVVIYVFVFINFPEISRMEGRPPKNLTPVFFNLYMITLLVMYVGLLFCLKREMEYIKTIEKFLGEKSPQKGT